MLNWFKPRVNTGSVSAEIESLLQHFDYQGLTDQNDPINRIAMDIMRDDFNQRLTGSAYLNIYGFKAQGSQFYLCERVTSNAFETGRRMCILTTGKSFPLGFEVTDGDDYDYINSNCELVTSTDDWDVLAEDRDEYERQKDFLNFLLPHFARFAERSTPISFFAFPQDHLLGYHVSARQITAEEADSAVAIMQRFP